MLKHKSKIGPRVYVIVRRDLDPRAIVAQACHAALEAGIHLKQIKEYPASIVVLQVANEEKLKKAHEKLKSKGIDNHLFFEPPMQQYTAIATEVTTDEQRTAFKKFQTLQLEHLK